MEDAEISELEDALSEKVQSSSRDIRHDFYFFTPSAKNTKVKVRLFVIVRFLCHFRLVSKPQHVNDL